MPLEATTESSHQAPASVANDERGRQSRPSLVGCRGLEPSPRARPDYIRAYISAVDCTRAELVKGRSSREIGELAGRRISPRSGRAALAARPGGGDATVPSLVRRSPQSSPPWGLAHERRLEPSQAWTLLLPGSRWMIQHGLRSTSGIPGQPALGSPMLGRTPSSPPPCGSGRFQGWIRRRTERSPPRLSVTTRPTSPRSASASARRTADAAPRARRAGHAGSVSGSTREAHRTPYRTGRPRRSCRSPASGNSAASRLGATIKEPSPSPTPS